MSPNNAPTIVPVEEALIQAAKGVDIILLEYINVRIKEPLDARGEELTTVVAACGLEYMTDNLFPRRRYRGSESWTWRMHREGLQVKGQGY